MVLTLTGLKTSLRNLIGALTGNEKIPLGVAGDLATTPNQLKAFILEDLQFPDGNVFGSFTVTPEQAPHWPGITLGAYPVGIPLLQALHLAVDCNVVQDATLLADTLTPLGGTIPLTNGTYSTANVAFMSQASLDFEHPDDGQPPLYREYIRGFAAFTNSEGIDTIDSHTASNSDTLDTRTITTVNIPFLDIFRDSDSWMLQVSFVPSTQTGAPANSFLAVLTLVWASTDTPLVAGTYSYGFRATPRLVGPTAPTLVASNVTPIGYYPVCTSTQDTIGNIFTTPIKYAGQVQPNNTNVFLTFTLNGSAHTLQVPFRQFVLGDSNVTNIISQLNIQLATFQLVMSLTQHGAIYVLGLRNTASTQAVVSFPTQQGVFTGSGWSNDVAAILNLYGCVFTLPPT